ncbi:MAG: T9SS type A sorting domain-containing protein [Ignavibacteriaceae bacterium]|nr:T9SS type A sorting domain-containing protein [Ignavibacteriaceae bacterium]
MKSSLLFVLCVVFSATGLFAQNDNHTGETPEIKLNQVTVPLVESTEALLFDNGPIVSLPAGGCSGGDASILDGTIGGHTLYGWGTNKNANYYMADDFTNSSVWVLDSLKFFAYQTGATALTLTGVYVQIWSGDPSLGGTVVWGDTVTNRLVVARLSNIYRAQSTTPTNCDRRVQEIVASCNATLPAGTYWLQWGLTGSLASGPWTPPVTIPGQAVTGNAKQKGPGGWTNALNGTTSPNGAPFIVYGSGNVVPVELTSFSAIVSGNTVELKWSTASEVNNRGFEVQRKSISGDYVNVGFVTGSGTTTEIKEYVFSDRELVSGAYSYRLRQVDFDGRSEYSQVVETEVSAPAVFELSQNYPNPFNPSTIINFSLESDSRVKLSVYNTLGQQVAVLVNGSMQAGGHSAEFSAASLPSGIYIAQIEAIDAAGKIFRSAIKMTLNK